MTIIPNWNKLLSMSWEIEATEQYLRDAKHYAKKHPDEYMAVMNNLEKYCTALNHASNPQLVQFGFLHEEPKGIRAIDQSGSHKGKLSQTRLYSYAIISSKVLYLICLGDKNSQAKDIRYAQGVVDQLRKTNAL